MYQEKTVESFVTHTTTKPEALGGQTREGKVPRAPGDHAPGWAGTNDGWQHPLSHCVALVHPFRMDMWRGKNVENLRE